MSAKVIVAYGSKYGATAEIAQKIGDVLTAEGLEADIKPADQAGKPEGYSAAVIGSGVYYGRWRKPASRFVKSNQDSLAEIPVWLFSSGPTGKGDPLELTEGWRSPKALEGVIDHIKPLDTALFNGAIDDQKISGFEKFVIKKVKAPSGDFRDWDAIEAWARAVAGTLKEQGPQSTVP
ncbi:MAG: flavodoxin domain-containing protein [Actinobacteria bacterium]|nr:flavodoxin domain-containing protein [Actinomycetota bacterium]